jgi:hypothetical protein
MNRIARVREKCRRNCRRALRRRRNGARAIAVRHREGDDAAEHHRRRSRATDHRECADRGCLGGELSTSGQEISRQIAHSASIAQSAVAQADRTNAMVEGLLEATQKIGEVMGLIQNIAAWATCWP